MNEGMPRQPLDPTSRDATTQDGATSETSTRAERLAGETGREAREVSNGDPGVHPGEPSGPAATRFSIPDPTTKDQPAEGGRSEAER